MPKPLTLPGGQKAAKKAAMSVIHGTCISIDDVGVLLRGPSGAGKSDLALRLIDGGATLVSDDYCEIDVRDNTVILSAPDAIAGRMEVRGVGVVSVAHQPHARLGLVVDLTPYTAIERLPEQTSARIANIAIKWIAVDPTHASADAKVRLMARLVATGKADD